MSLLGRWGDGGWGASSAAALAATVVLIAAGSAWGFSSTPFRSSPALPAGSDRSRRDPSLSSSSVLRLASPGLAEPSPAATARFSERNVLVTGASGGLGRAMANHFARCGAATLVLSGRDEDALKQAAAECAEAAKSHGNSGGLYVVTVPCDLSDPGSVTKLGEEALKACRTASGGGNNSGVVDVLVNCGGISSRSNFLETNVDVDELLMRVNFHSGAALAKALVPSMVEKGEGAVIWVSSVQGLVGIPSRTSYAASKFAVQGYCEAMRAELASSGVTVHVASPGYIRTNLSRSAITGDGKKYEKMDDTTANGADPDDVAASIIESVTSGKADFVVAANFSAKAAIWLRLLAPSFLNKMLVKRFEKSQ